MKRFCNVLLVPLAFLACTTAAHASTVLMATLSNAAEIPPTVPTLVTGAPRPASSGTAMFVLNDAMTAMTMTVTVFNVDLTGNQTPDPNDNVVAAHIHAGTAPQPANYSVVWGFLGSPFNDNAPNDVTMTPLASGAGGTITGKWDASEGNGTTLTEQLPNLLAGRSYINFHTMQFTGGEIRGNLVVVPEPATFSLLGAGTLAILLVRRRSAKG